MASTNIPYGSALAVKLQSAGLFAANMQRNTTINRLTGKFPQQADAEQTIRNQSSSEMPIVKCMDLTKVAGDEITFDLINPMGGKPIMGSAVAEGQGRKMSFSQDRLRINQARYPISAGDTMTQQRTPHELRKLARAMGQNYMNQTNRLWMEIFQIVKENCTGEYSGVNPQDDVMERLLTARKGK